MKKVHTIADDAGRKFVKERAHALNRQHQGTAVNRCESVRDFAGRRMHAARRTGIEGPRRDKGEMQVGERDDPYFDRSRAIDDTYVSGAQRMDASDHAQCSILPAADNESGGRQRVLDTFPFPTGGSNEREFRFTHSVAGCYWKTVIGVELESAVNAH